jgi:predicted RNA polymerase sigma factor
VDANRALERAARDSYGRLVAYLTARSRDVAGAEDALGDAFRAALETWPRTGVPDNPDAWLLTAARRRLIDGFRHANVVAAAATDLLRGVEEAQERANSDVAIPERRLELLFVCAHPAIHPAARAPLMLQTVLGLDAVRIASAFLVRPTTMGQRLSRAKAKIREAGIPFMVPEDRALPERLDAVLGAIYAAYGSGWDDVAGADPRLKGLAEEAIEMGRLLARLMPSQPEALGVLALMLHCEARRDARRAARGAYAPLAGQDVSLWSVDMIDEAEACLKRAARANTLGRFQLEAAIQSVHAQRRGTGTTDWEAIALLYEGLLRIAPTIVAIVGRAAEKA